MSDFVATATVEIHEAPEKVWDALTDPDQIAVYMYGTRVETTWRVGDPITWSGEYQGASYEDRGEVLTFDAPRTLSMTHRSGARQEDSPDTAHTITYTLQPGTLMRVTLTQDGCTDQAQAELFSNNWQQTLESLKAHVEG